LSENCEKTHHGAKKSNNKITFFIKIMFWVVLVNNKFVNFATQFNEELIYGANIIIFLKIKIK